MTLYEELQDLDMLARSSAASIYIIRSEYANLSKLKANLVIPEPKNDVPDLQRKAFGRYDHIPFLNDALFQRQSLEDSLTWMGKAYGISDIWLPRMEDEKHDEAVRQMGELIKEPSHLLSDHGMDFISAGTAGLLTAVGCVGMMYGLEALDLWH